jgi:hypothetical protein
MKVDKLVAELEFGFADDEVLVDVNGVKLDIEDVINTSHGVTITLAPDGYDPPPPDDLDEADDPDDIDEHDWRMGL